MGFEKKVLQISQFFENEFKCCKCNNLDKMWSLLHVKFPSCSRFLWDSEKFKWESFRVQVFGQWRMKGKTRVSEKGLKIGLEFSFGGI